MNPLTRQLTQLDRSPYEIRRSGFSREALGHICSLRGTQRAAQMSVPNMLHRPDGGFDP